MGRMCGSRLLVWLLAAAPVAAAPAAAREGCAPEKAVSGRVVAPAGGGDLRLADGRIVRLAGVATQFAVPGHAEGLDIALAELAVGRTVLVASDGGADRYGRLSGVVRVEGAGEYSLQQALVELGLAAMRPEPGYPDCAAELEAVEADARRARRGIWEHLPLDAGVPERVRDEIGRFTVVEGRIFAAGTGGNSAYLNFGRTWREDVTVRVPDSARPALTAAGLEPETLAGRRVLVRGVVEEAGGPLIEVRRPEQMRVESRDVRN